MVHPAGCQQPAPAKAGAAFVAGMADVLGVYHRPHDPDRPVVCLDETSKQLIAETRMPIPAKPGHPKRYDYEYQRNGTANLFMMFAPLEGWRHVESLPRRRPGSQIATPPSITRRFSKTCRTSTSPTSRRSYSARNIGG